MVEPVEFPSEITLTKHEALDLVAACDDLLDFAEAGSHVEVAFTVEGMRRLVLGGSWAKPAKTERGSGGWAASVGGDVVGAEHQVTLDGVGGERAAVDEVVEVPRTDAEPAGGLPAGEPVHVLLPAGSRSIFHDISLY
jgi:hypothetical protein